MPSPQTVQILAELDLKSPVSKRSPRPSKAAQSKRASEKPSVELKCSAPFGVTLPRLMSRPVGV